jgi:hypothetical protein
MDNRIADLERSVQALRVQLRVCIGVAVVGVTCAMLGLADAKDAEPGVVRASMILLESGGKTRAILMGDGDGATLTLRRGDASTVLSSAEGKQGLVLRNANDKPQGLFTLSPVGTTFMIASDTGDPLIGIAAHLPESRPHLALFGKDSKPAARLEVGTMGTVLSLFDGEGKPRTALTAGADKGFIVFYDKDGKPMP